MAHPPRRPSSHPEPSAEPSATRPPLDPDIAAAARLYEQLYPDETRLRTADDIGTARANWPPPDLDDVLLGRRVRHETRTVTVDDALIELSIFRPPVPGTLPMPGFYLIHGGGMVSGHRHHIADDAIRIVERFDAVVVTVEYRLAPEFSDPVPVEDCYAGLVWFAGEALPLGVDRSRIVVMGWSAGGGLAAGVALLARDRGGPPLAAQVLVCPMLDDRNETTSAWQFDHTGWWDRGENEVGWKALLGERTGTDTVSRYAAPARAPDLRALPPTFIDVGSAEVLRDECVAYASRLWAAGGDAELHVWGGGLHGFDGRFPQTPIAQSAVRARYDWLKRLLSRTTPA